MTSKEMREAQAGALVEATKFVDSLRFRGERLVAGQPHAWPRKGVFRDDGTPVVDAPPEIQELRFYIAANLLTGVPMSDDVRATIQRMVGPLLDPDIKVFDGAVTSH